MSRENYSKYLQNKDSDILHSTGYSNSRLGGNWFCCKVKNIANH